MLLNTKIGSHELVISSRLPVTINGSLALRIVGIVSVLFEQRQNGTTGNSLRSDHNTLLNLSPFYLARGLDIPSIHNVVNYEVARDIDTHTHRVGRTGRAGMKGTAYTLFVAGKDPADFAACLVQHLESASQSVPPRLLDIAKSCAWFAQNRSALSSLGTVGQGVSRPSYGFEPRPPRARPGLGLSDMDYSDTQTHNVSQNISVTGEASDVGRSSGKPGLF